MRLSGLGRSRFPFEARSGIDWAAARASVESPGAVAVKAAGAAVPSSVGAARGEVAALKKRIGDLEKFSANVKAAEKWQIDQKNKAIANVNKLVAWVATKLKLTQAEVRKQAGLAGGFGAVQDDALVVHLTQDFNAAQVEAFDRSLNMMAGELGGLGSWLSKLVKKAKPILSAIPVVGGVAEALFPDKPQAVTVPAPAVVPAANSQVPSASTAFPAADAMMNVWNSLLSVVRSDPVPSKSAAVTVPAKTDWTPFMIGGGLLLGLIVLAKR